MSHSGEEEDDNHDYHIPLEDQRIFGAGIKRKRISFVPAQSNETTAPQPHSPSRPTGLGDRYLAIVLGKQNARLPSADEANETRLCDVCKQPVSRTADEKDVGPHESSIAHQVCMTHSHPPSHLDRAHVGVRYLAEYGWDPDARTGLGARREGIRAPIKAKAKNDTAGLGLDTGVEEDTVSKRPAPVKKEAKIVKLNAGQIRKLESEKKRRAERLRQSFYGEDLSRYLGPDG